MGYDTNFTGQFDLDKPLDDETFDILQRFCFIRHMKREFPDDKYGVEGEFFLDGEGKGEARNEIRESIVDHNQPPSTQPSLWCDWEPTEDRLHIKWDGMEKFHDYEKWIQYICDNFLEPRGYVLSGSVGWQGEDSSDNGEIIAINNFIFTTEQSIYHALQQKAEEKGITTDELLGTGENLPPLLGLDKGLDKWIEIKLGK
jgi:hypothetical protein